MAKKRRAWERVKSGFVIGGTLVLGIIFFAALVLCASVLTARTNVLTQGAHPLLGTLALLTLSTILFYTTRIWAKWLLAILAYCAIRLLIGVPFVLVFESMRQPDLDAAQYLIPALLISTLLALRFVKWPPKGAERPGLVMFLVCLVFAMVSQSWVPWGIGIVVLASGNAVHFLMTRPKSRYNNLSPSI